MCFRNWPGKCLKTQQLNADYSVLNLLLLVKSKPLEAYINYNNYLTVLEAIGRAGGVGDYGNRNRYGCSSNG